MTVTLNISITQKMRDYIDQQISDGDFASASDYVRSLIRADSEKRLERLLIEGAKSGTGRVVDRQGRKAFGDKIESRIRRAGKGAA